MTLRPSKICCAFLVSMIGVIVAGGRGAIALEDEPAVHWLDNYQEALEAATNRSQFALVWFYDPAATQANWRFEQDVLSLSLIADAIAERCIAVKLPVGAKSASEENP